MASSSSSQRWFWQRPHELALLAAIVLVICGTATLDKNHAYVKSPDVVLKDNARRFAPLGMLALGATVVIIAGGIDLSAGSMAALSGTVCASVMLMAGGKSFDSTAGVAPGVLALAIGCSISTALVVGTLHAWMITSLRLPPFIVTLGSLVGLRSLGQAICFFVTKRFKGSGSEDLPFSDPFFDLLKDRVEISVILLAVIAAFTAFILSRTVLGRHLHALGGNEQASVLSGVRTENVKWAAYVFSAVVSALAGIFYISEGGAKPTATANGYELYAIAAAVVGGCSLQGGIGTVSGTILGTIFLRLVVDGVGRVIKTSSNIWEGIIVGIVVVGAVTITQFTEIRRSGRSLFPGPLGWVAMPCLILSAALLGLVSVGPTGAITTGTLALLTLASVKFSEQRSVR